MLTEKYRPCTWLEVIGQEKIVKQLSILRSRDGIAGRAYFVTGGSGTGKTTIARLIAAEIADDFSIEEIDAGSISLAALREIESNWMLSGFGVKSGRAYIINEAHGMRKDVIRQLLVMLERIPRHVAIVFTTTNDGEEMLFEDCPDASPLLSRCIRLDLARRDLAQKFAERALQIAAKENLGSAALKTVVKLVQEKRNNFRAVLQEIEAGAFISDDAVSVGAPGLTISYDDATGEKLVNGKPAIK